MVRLAYLLFVASLVAVAGCSHYRLGAFGTNLKAGASVVIPFVAGDKDGILTQALVEEVCARTPLHYHPCQGDYQLDVAIVDQAKRNVGFRYDRSRKGKIKDYIIPTETRLTLLVEVQLVDVQSNSRLLGPVVIGASVDFDHEYYSSYNGINVFSLGQLSDYDAGRDAAWRPLSQKIAAEVADYLLINLALGVKPD